MHLSVDSEKEVVRLRHDLERACARHGLAVASVTAVDPARSVRGSFVLELADPLPDLRPAADSGRPDRSTYKIAGFERPGGGTRLSTIRPTELVGLLGHPEMAEPAARLERTLEAVLRAAAGERAT
jgi:hypothetical protein